MQIEPPLSRLRSPIRNSLSLFYILLNVQRIHNFRLFRDYDIILLFPIHSFASFFVPSPIQMLTGVQQDIRVYRHRLRVIAFSKFERSQREVCTNVPPALCRFADQQSQ